ncbi:MAG: F0F1 ATP synthase subunit epsilon [Candidatus Eisenbacteria sp.]|nr:F0F1 ATP synthase subunit epsilon [Candidatus Eisenbacteria bacterium]
MESTYDVELLTPEKTVLKAQIVSMIVPGTEGFLGVLANHAPLITGLVPGLLALTFPDGRKEEYCISGGFLEVSGNHAVVLADSVERPGEIDIERAENAKERARVQLKERKGELDVARAEAALKRAFARLRVGRRSVGV